MIAQARRACMPDPQVVSPAGEDGRRKTEDQGRKAAGQRKTAGPEEAGGREDRGKRRT